MAGRAHRMADRLTRLLEHFLAVMLFAMFAVVLLLVILRYLFSTTIIGGNEATAIAFVFLTAIGAAIDLYRGEHISIRYFADKMSPHAGERLSKARYVLLLILNAVILGYAYAWISRTGSFLMPALGLPQMVAQVCIPIGCVLSIFYCAIRLIPGPEPEANARWQE